MLEIYKIFIEANNNLLNYTDKNEQLIIYCTNVAQPTDREMTKLLIYNLKKNTLLFSIISTNIFFIFYTLMSR